MKEEWRTIPGFSRYQASNLGNIKGIHGKPMKLLPRQKGYLTVGITNDDGIMRKMSVHRLIAFAFLKPPIDDETAVDHINRVKDDNRASNLRWITNSKNILNKINSVGIVEHIIELHNNGYTPKMIYDSLK